MKTRRSVSLLDTIQRWCKEWKPDCEFSAGTPAAFRSWQRRFRRLYLGLLGPWPEKAPLRTKVIETVDKGDHLRKKIIFDSSRGVTVPAFILEPKGLKRGERRAAILASHGHGSGKASVVGLTSEVGSPNEVARVSRLNYEYGLEAVRRGYVVIAPDWCPFGERLPNPNWLRVNRDPCDITNLALLYFGRPILTQSIFDGIRCIDVLETHPHVNPRRMGVIGLSHGGTMAAHLLINEPRLRAGVVSGYISTIREDALTMRGCGNTCGAQHVPGLLLHGDIPDMLGLICPKPVLYEMGRKETCFHYPDMAKAYARVERIYRVAGHAERIARDDHPNGHRWSGNKAWAWLEKWL